MRTPRRGTAERDGAVPAPRPTPDDGTGLDEPTVALRRPATDLFAPRRPVTAPRPPAADPEADRMMGGPAADLFTGPFPSAGRPPVPAGPDQTGPRAAGPGPGGDGRAPGGAGSGGDGPGGGGPDDPDPDGDPDGAPRRRMSGLRKALIGVAVLLVLLVTGGAVGVHLVTTRVLGDVQRIPGVFDSLDESTRPQKPAGAEKTVNFLLVGVDTRAPEQTTGSEGDGDVFVPGRQRSDVIMVVHVAADRKSASVVSVPRDSWVEIPGNGRAKVNAAYSLGGGALLVRTVESLTGLRMDHFAVVDFAGFKDITDAVGGIDVTVAEDTGDQRGAFPAGPNHLDGDQALVYARQRYNLPQGDLDRVRRQQNVIKALMTKAASRGLLSSPAGTLGLADSVARAVSVDDTLDNGDLRSLVLSLRHLRPGAVKFVTAPVAGFGREGKQSVVRLDGRQAAELWQAVADETVGDYVRRHPGDALGSNPR